MQGAKKFQLQWWKGLKKKYTQGIIPIVMQPSDSDGWGYFDKTCSSELVTVNLSRKWRSKKPVHQCICPKETAFKFQLKRILTSLQDSPRLLMLTLSRPWFRITFVCTKKVSASAYHCNYVKVSWHSQANTCKPNKKLTTQMLKAVKLES